MTAMTTTRPARPGPPAPLLIWTLDDDGTQINDGKPMTGLQAAEHVRRWDGYGARIRDGKLETWRLQASAGVMRVSTWSPTWPPTEADRIVGDLLLDLPLSVIQGDLFANALRAAGGRDDRTAGELLRQLLATTMPREGQ